MFSPELLGWTNELFKRLLARRNKRFRPLFGGTVRRAPPSFFVWRSLVSATYRAVENHEVWLRGPVAGVPPMLQPVAHALLQAREEVTAALADFPDALLWERPAGAASVGFHLQHLAGVLERLFSYARGEALSEVQLTALGEEGRASAI